MNDRDDGRDDDSVTVVWAEQKFSPIQYESFGVGPFYYKTTVKPGETPAQAMHRAYAVLQEFARTTYPGKRDEFFEQHADALERSRKPKTSIVPVPPRRSDG